MPPKKNRGLYGNYVLTVDGEQKNSSAQGQKKKKTPRNAFYFYMQDFREDQEARGVFYHSQKEVADAAAASWSELSSEERKPYQDAAKEAKEKDKADLANKYTSQGKSYAQVNKEQLEREQQKQKMLNEIRGTVRSLRTPAALNNYPFHLIHVNYYCIATGGLYVPCELAISEFTLLDGVRRVFRMLINPGDIPLGFKFDAEKHSAETHKIPMPDEFRFEGVVNNYPKAFESVHSFLREAKAEYKLPPLYTVESDIPACDNVLENLCDSVNEDNMFRVYPAKEVFFELQHACVDVFKPTDPNIVKLPFTSLAERELDKDIFDYTKEIACKFHEGTDAIPYCSVSKVTRWGFLILDFCHQVTKMPLIPGKHVPLHTNVSQLKKLQAAVQQKKVDDDTTKLNAAMQNMRLKASGTNAWKRQETALRPPQKLSEAINLLSPGGSDDEFPPLK